MTEVQPLMGWPSDDGQRRRSKAVPTAALCWAGSLFVLVQMALLAGSEAVALQLGGALAVAVSPAGMLTGVAVGLGLAVACAVAVMRAGRGSPWACVVAGAAVGVIALVLGAMVVQQWSVGASIAEVALIAGETTPAQSVLAISVLLLAVGAVLTPVIGLRRRTP